MSRIAAMPNGVCGINRDRNIACRNAAPMLPAAPGPYVDLDVSNDLFWGLHEDGSIHGAMRAFPSGSYTALAAGGNYACGVTRNVRLMPEGIVCDPTVLITDVYYGLTFTKVAVEYHGRVCGILADQTIACWAPSLDGYYTFQGPVGRFVDITATSGGMCAISVDGSILCFGDTPVQPSDGW